VATGSCVGKHERKPHHGNVPDVQHRRTSDQRVRAGSLDLVELEAVVGYGVSTARELPAKSIER
jgi:hypothetical protein